jgi:adhesin/invasin
VKARLPIALAAASSALALAAALAAGCGGLLIIQEPPDGGTCCDGGLPDGGQTQNGPPSKARSSLLILPDTTGVADGLTPITVRVTVRDAAGHLLNGVGVTMTCDGSNNAFNPSGGTGYTGADGTFQAALYTTTAEPKTVTVAVASFTFTAQLTFVAGPPDPSSSTLDLTPVPPTTVLADGVATATATATLRDQFSNIVAGYPVAFTATGANNAFTPAGAVNTDASGVSRVRLTSTRAEPKTVVATVGSLFVMTQPAQFAAGVASQSMSSLTANPTLLPADGTTITTLTVLARDANGNPVPNKPVTFSATGSGNTFPQGTSASTSVDGVARVQLASTVAETKAVTAQAAGLNLNATVRFGAGSPTNGNSFITVETPIQADGVASGLITVTVRDPTNNPVVNTPVSLSATGSLNTFTAVTGGSVTDASGLFRMRLSSTAAEAKAVTATVGSGPGTFQLTALMTFTPGPPTAGSSQLTASSQHVLADGKEITTLTATYRDVNGNPVPGLLVTFSSSGSANVFSATNGSTDSNGAFSVTLKSTRAELKTVSANAAGVTLQILVSFDPGPPTAATSSVTANPTSLPIGGSSDTTITATIRDALNNPVPNVPTSMDATGSQNYFDPPFPNGFTGSSGTFQALLHSYIAETKTVTVTAGTLTLTTTVTFGPGDPSSGSSTLSVSPAQVKADGIAYGTVVYTVRDFSGNLVPNYPVSLSTFDQSDVWSPSSTGFTNASGVYTARISSTYVGSRTIQASANGMGIAYASFQFVP